MDALPCSFCRRPLKHIFVDLGMAPLVSSYLREEELHNSEVFYPLRVYVCEECYLVQLPQAASPQQLFGQYPYFSSVSASWLKHSKTYVEQMMQRFNFDSGSLVIEIASNDGYLLQYFKEKGVPVLGVEPAANVAEAAQKAGIPTLVKFFGVETAKELVREGKQADLLLGNNVLAHVPDANDFVGGMKALLKPNGIITMEFPHLLKLIGENQFDTIFHEHFSYFSFLTVERIFAAHHLELFDVEELPTHGGSLRIYARHTADQSEGKSERVLELKDRELQAGLNRIETYASFEEKARLTKHKLVKFLVEIKQDHRSIVGYGAAGKGCILLNYCGIRSDFLDYVVDLSPHKQGLFLPGTHNPIYPPARIRETKPDYLLILPWNLKKEIMEQMSFIREWGGKFIVPIPEVAVH
jgi:2-polyprenyl-3-methyl-5-hydroxy-6-metoxy-1,4-benzoquinol methylase